MTFSPAGDFLATCHAGSVAIYLWCCSFVIVSLLFFPFLFVWALQVLFILTYVFMMIFVFRTNRSHFSSLLVSKTAAAPTPIEMPTSSQPVSSADDSATTVEAQVCVVVLVFPSLWVKGGNIESMLDSGKFFEIFFLLWNVVDSKVTSYSIRRRPLISLEANWIPP